LLVPVLVLVLMVAQPDDRCNPRRERKVEEPARSATIRPAVLAATAAVAQEARRIEPTRSTARRSTTVGSVVDKASAS
jgi:hypothetical protein